MFDLLWVSLEDLERILEHAQDFTQCLSTLCDPGWLAQCRGKALVRVHLVVEFELEGVLRFPDHKEADGLWDGVFDVSQYD